MARRLRLVERRLTGTFGATSWKRSGPEQTRGAGRRRGTTARERKGLSEQKLARSAHLPQKLANWALFTRLGRFWVPAANWHPGSPIFFGVAKLNTCIDSIHLFVLFWAWGSGGAGWGGKNFLGAGRAARCQVSGVGCPFDQAQGRPVSGVPSTKLRAGRCQVAEVADGAAVEVAGTPSRGQMSIDPAIFLAVRG